MENHRQTMPAMGSGEKILVIVYFVIPIQLKLPRPGQKPKAAQIWKGRGTFMCPSFLINFTAPGRLRNIDTSRGLREATIMCTKLSDM